MNTVTKLATAQIALRMSQSDSAAEHAADKRVKAAWKALTLEDRVILRSVAAALTRIAETPLPTRRKRAA